ncbi:MAG: hypothetical protein PHV11_10465 [Candidatus Bipolaricaulis sp.]|nr:hypothetical protein [Candidatus Bipolaricaulis sp.]
MTESSDEKGRFKYTYKLPADPSGNGRQLRVITVVYEDNGYTSRNANYQVEENTVVVRDMNIMGHSGGGGSDIDYKKVREIVKEELGKLPPYPVLEDIKKQIKDALKAVLRQIKDIPEADLTIIRDDIAQLSQSISNIPPFPDIPVFDYSKLDEIKVLLSLLEKSPKIERLKDYSDIKKISKETIKQTELLLNEILDKLDEE